MISPFFSNYNHKFFWMSLLIGQNNISHKPEDELIYRRALRIALNILDDGASAKDDSPSKGRRVKLATCENAKEGHLTSRQQHSASGSSQKRKRKDKTSNEPHAALIKNKRTLSSRTKAEETSACKPFERNLRPCQSNGELDSQYPLSISKTKTERTPPKDVQRKPLPKSTASKKSSYSLKKNVGHHQKTEASGGECHSPSSVASLHLRRTSTPTSPKSCPRLTWRGKKSTAKHTLKRALVVSPNQPASTNLADHSLEQEETPPNKYSKASDGSRCLKDLEETLRRESHVALSASRERQCVCSPKALNCGPSPDGLVLEHEEEKNQISDGNTTQNFQFQDLEDEGSVCFVKTASSVPLQDVLSGRSLELSLENTLIFWKVSTEFCCVLTWLTRISPRAVSGIQDTSLRNIDAKILIILRLLCFFGWVK